MRLSKTTCLAVVLMIWSTAHGQVPVWHCTLNDVASIVDDNWGFNTGGDIENGPPTFVLGAIDNAFAGNGSVYAEWNNIEVENIFGSWNNGSGITVDLYFRGDHWSTHSGDSGLWSIVRRSSDLYIILSVQNGKMRHLFSDDASDQHKYPIPGVTLADNTTYRLTVRQANGEFDVYLNGGEYSNTNPVFSAGDLSPGYTWDFVPPGGSPSRRMNVANRAIFGGELQSGEWVDNVRVYNGFYSPVELDAGGLPVALINTDKTWGYAPVTVNFDGSNSYDTDATNVITNYAWDYTNDGIVDDSGPSPTTSHLYTTANTYVCKLTVTDDESQTASSMVTINVYTPPPPGLVPVTAMLPDGGPLSGHQMLTSITASGHTLTDLVGPTTVELVPGPGDFGDTENNDLCGLGDNLEKALLGLELGRGITNLGDPGEEYIRAFFPTGVTVDGDGTGKPEVFVLEYADSRDNFQIQLLTSGPGETPVIAATVQVRNVDYIQTTTRMTAFTDNSPVGGVGVDLDAIGVAGITGVQIPGDDGFGLSTGIEPCIVAAVVDPGATFAPITEATASPASGGYPLEVNFSACTSYDPDGQALTYAWDFENDGSDDDYGEYVTHTYNTGGTYLAKLTVTDEDDLFDTDMVTITVSGPNYKRIIIDLEADPQIRLTSITTEYPGGEPTFEATALVGPPDTTDGGVPPDYLYIELDGYDDDEADLVGLDLGGTGISPGGEHFLRAYFADDVVINPDGTDAPEVFVIEQASSTDDFQFQLLTSGPGVIPPAIAATVQIYAAEYGNVGGNRGGVGLDLDVLGLAGIRGVQIPGNDGLGGETGIDPAVIAGIPTGCNIPFADADTDGDVDQDDFAIFQRCFTGSADGHPPIPTDPGLCFCLDSNEDEAIGETDFNNFQDCSTGPGIPWSQELTPDCNP